MRSHEESTYACHISQRFGKMKEIILNVDDSAYEHVLGMLRLFHDVNVVETDGEQMATSMDVSFARAISELEKRKVIRFPRDHSYIMAAMNEELLKGAPFFYSPLDYIAYLKFLGIEKTPGKTTLYDTLHTIGGHYPEWTFSDGPSDVEGKRRINIVRLFLLAFNRNRCSNPEASRKE